MKGKVVSITWWLLLLLAVTASPVAAQHGEAVYLPGWVAWVMVVVALLVPAILYFVLKDRGRL